jgi:transposase
VKLDTKIEQLELMLEDLEEGEAAQTATAAQRAPDQPQRERHQPVGRPLPDHLPREEIVHHPGSVCPDCGGIHFAKLGEEVTEVLEKIPARLKVNRHFGRRSVAGAACASCKRRRPIC